MSISRSIMLCRRSWCDLGFPDNEALQATSHSIYEHGGVVSSVCHGAVGLLNIRLSNGSLLVKGKQVMGFSNEEEKLAELDTFVPFSTLYKKADKAWALFAIEDSRLITGQNPASGGAGSQRCGNLPDHPLGLTHPGFRSRCGKWFLWCHRRGQARKRREKSEETHRRDHERHRDGL